MTIRRGKNNQFQCIGEDGRPEAGQSATWKIAFNLKVLYDLRVRIDLEL